MCSRIGDTDQGGAWRERGTRTDRWIEMECGSNGGIRGKEEIRGRLLCWWKGRERDEETE